MTSSADLVRALVAPHAAALGLELVDVAVRGEGRGRLVRVVVARAGGVDVGTCTALSRAVSPDLDDGAGLDGGYRLEVTSPGVDHPLTTPGDYARVAGRPVRVQTRADGGTDAGPARQLDGTVHAADDEAVVLDLGDEQVRVPYDQIARARQRLPW